MDKEKEEEQKTIDTEEYEYGDTDLENEEEDEDDDEYDGMYAELEDEKFDNLVKEDYEQVEELKPLRVSSWIHPKSGKTMHGIEVVTRKDDVEIDFDDYSNLCVATLINVKPNGETRIPKRTDEPDVCSICYGVWTSHGNHQVCSLPCGHVYGMSCIKRWIQTAETCPQCNEEYTSEDVGPIYATRICNLAADQKAPIRCFSFSRLGYIAFKKYEFARRNHAWDKRRDALKRHADIVGRQNDAMKRRSEILDRRASVLKRAKALEHLRSAKTLKLRAKALHERARAFGLQVNAFKPRLKFFEDSHYKFHGLAKKPH